VANGIIIQEYKDGNPVPSGLSLAAVDKPASVIMIHEGSSILNGAFVRPVKKDPPSNTYYLFNYSGAAMDRQHFNGSNLTFADGHVKWKKLSSICMTDFGVDKSPDVCGDGSSSTTATGRF
jgi:prepilin-type processing-associated H-X9-DG protein